MSEEANNEGGLSGLKKTLIGTLGTVVTAGGDNVSFMNIPSGSFLPIQVIRVLTSTTAGRIIALW